MPIAKKTKKSTPEVGSLYSVEWRHYFSDDRAVLDLPNLVEIQVDSYKEFLENSVEKAFKEVFPISDFSGEKVDIFYKELEFEQPAGSFAEYKKRNMTYEASLKVRFEMLNKETGEITEDTVFMGGVPLMTSRGTFIINGVEKVVVNQIIKSDGLFFEPDKTDASVYTAKIKPKRGAWLEIMPDKKKVLSVRIDKKRKIPVTTLLRAFGLESDTNILKALKPAGKEAIADYLEPTLAKDKTTNQMEAMHVIYKLLRPGDLGTDERVQELFNVTFADKKRFDLGEIARMKMNAKLGLKREYDSENGKFLDTDDLVGTVVYLMNILTGKEDFIGDDIDRLDNRRIRSVGELVFDKLKIGLARTERIAKDRMTVIDVNEATARNFINHRPIEAVLKEFFASGQLSQFMDQSNPLSELAHKRRISAMGPGGLTRERASFEVRDVHPTQYGRICPIATPEGPNIGLVLHVSAYARVNKYGFLMSPYRSIGHAVKNNGKDAINKIAESDIVVGKKTIVKAGAIIKKADAEALKKDYKEKEIEVRAFLTNECIYVDATEERVLTIAEANSQVDEHGNFLETIIGARHDSEAILVPVSQVTHIDVSPKQIMSLSTSLLPFLEHDDATRAEMGTNMMRQACPLVHPESPIVGTGMERVVGRNSGYAVLAEEDGEVIGIDAKHISVLYKTGEKKTYEFTTFERSNQDLIVHQRPVIGKGEKFKKGAVLADGQAMENGELAIGRNLLVAYMSWEGYNFEDAVIISSRLIQEDKFTNISIHEYVLDVRETKLGPEQTTSDIPNVSYTKLKDLDENGIIRIGATVHGDDILVGKITPKGEQELSPEERLLRAIFGDKSKDVKDSSLYLPSGSAGKIIDVQILRKENGDNLPTGVFEQIKVYVAQTQKIEVGDKMAGRHGNKGIVAAIVPEEDMPFTKDGQPVDIILNPLGVISRMNIGQLLETHLGIAAKHLGIKVATPILNGVSYNQIEDLMQKAGVDVSGKEQLFNGKTGEAFKEKTTLGIIYMLKLHHLVEHKIHARSVGPYSMITQQPLGGKAQNGGQRFGEMECWAIQGYGAANILQELLTIKSDDINGRSQAYQAIVKNEQIKRPSVPESFNVLLTELQALNLRIDLLDEGDLEKQEAVMHERFTNLSEITLEDVMNQQNEVTEEETTVEAEVAEETTTEEVVAEEVVEALEEAPESEETTEQ